MRAPSRRQAGAFHQPGHTFSFGIHCEASEVLAISILAEPLSRRRVFFLLVRRRRLAFSVTPDNQGPPTSTLALLFRLLGPPYPRQPLRRCGPGETSHVPKLPDAPNSNPSDNDNDNDNGCRPGGPALDGFN